MTGVTQILSPAHEAAFYEQDKLLIWETLDGYESVALTRKEVAALRALITPAITDEQITELLKKLDTIAQEYDRDSWGLPYLNKKSGLAMREAIRDWLAVINQPPVAGQKE